MTVVSALSLSFLLEYWYKTNVYEMITHYTSYQQCQTVSNNVNSVNSVNSVNNVNSFSAVLPPSPMVFFCCWVFINAYLLGYFCNLIFANTNRANKKKIDIARSHSKSLWRQRARLTTVATLMMDIFLSGRCFFSYSCKKMNFHRLKIKLWILDGWAPLYVLWSELKS